MKKNKLYVFAGPNGSGKSTITSNFVSYFLSNNIIYVNADIIAQEIFSDIEDEYDRNLQASKVATNLRNTLIEQRKDFAFETVLSTERNLNLMKNAKEKGYEIYCIYCLTRSPQINIDRVQQRVKEGGHSVDDETIEKRYIKCLELLPKVIEVSDKMFIYDNSDNYQLLLIKKENNIIIITNDYNDEWLLQNIVNPLKNQGLNCTLILKEFIPSREEIISAEDLENFSIEDFII
ncbi:MAG: hypothetical protein E7374_01330 [Clostridiales bacterium]|nr:hypothetical protein [Clostridiales bacterium]